MSEIQETMSCRTCKLEKPITSFRAYERGYIARECSTCVNERSRAYRKGLRQNPEYVLRERARCRQSSKRNKESRNAASRDGVGL